jgi:hypothetical protein
MGAAPGSIIATIITHHMAKIRAAYPGVLNRLHASGMGFSYSVGNLGKIIGPLGLALAMSRFRPAGFRDCAPRDPIAGGPGRRRSAAFRDGWTAWRRRASRNPAAPRNVVSL